jgi:hypothetical protein
LPHTGEILPLAGAVAAAAADFEHDPEKWEPVSRLREALIRFFVSLDASAGEGRSEKIMLQQKKIEEGLA